MRHKRRERKKHLNGLPYQMYGTIRYRTRFWYSAYPGRFFTRKRSSSRSRHSTTGTRIAPTTTSPQHEPSASGVPTRYTNEHAYSGWRTSAYGPVEMTLWSLATSTVVDRNGFSRNGRKHKVYPAATSTLPSTTPPSG